MRGLTSRIAQGGRGDLLAGFLGGLLAQPRLQADALKTISYAVWEHGAAADRLARTRKNWNGDGNGTHQVVEFVTAVMVGEARTQLALLKFVSPSI